jgi:hypothetical protein
MNSDFCRVNKTFLNLIAASVRAPTIDELERLEQIARANTYFKETFDNWFFTHFRLYMEWLNELGDDDNSSEYENCC